MKKLIIAMILIVSMMMVSVSPVMAADDSNEGIMVDGSYLLHELESTHIVYSPLRGYFLANGSGAITMPAAGRVGASGNTVAYKSVPVVKVAVTVEKYTGKSWVSVYSWTAQKENDYSVSTSRTISVPSKYYYRVSTIHSAGGEVMSGYTNGIWVI